MKRRQVVRIQGSTVVGESPSIAEMSWSFLAGYSLNENLGIDFVQEPVRDFQRVKASLEILAVRIPLEDSPQLLANIPSRPSDVNQIKAFDHWIYEGTQFWPRLLWAKAIRSLIVSKVNSLDIRQACIIVGEGAWVTLSAWVAADLGYSRIFVVNENPLGLDKQVGLLKSVLVGIEIQGILADQLTLQIIKCSLLLNSLDLSNKPELLGDIGYFNFMSALGLVVDLPSFICNHDLLSEADSAGLLILDSLDLQAHLDFDFLRMIKAPGVTEPQRSQFVDEWRSKN
ncbi:MAG: hypothetical protein JNM39_12390 [Bdellovibrionaceae bacterium]|nr:hypothetical protein [Pseudobdellovibrionaceae bacterium]